MVRKKFNFLLVSLLTSYYSFSQDNNLADSIEDATEEVSDIFSKVKTLLFVIAGIVAVYGAISVYSKYQSQDPDASKAAAKFAFGFIFLMTAAFIIEGYLIG